MLDSNNFELLIVEITTRLLSKDDWAFNAQIALFNQKPIIIRLINLTGLLCDVVDMFVEVMKIFIRINGHSIGLYNFQVNGYNFVFCRPTLSPVESNSLTVALMNPSSAGTGIYLAS